MRWLVVLLVAVHGFLTPGQPLWPGGMAPSWEGLAQGGRQTVRLILLAGMAWALVRTSSVWELVGALHALTRWLERWGVPVGRGLALVAFALGRLPMLQGEVGQIREALCLRLGRPGGGGRWSRLVLAGEALLWRVGWDVARQEEALRARGYDRTLPALFPTGRGWGGREWGITVVAGIPWLLP